MISDGGFLGERAGIVGKIYKMRLAISHEQAANRARMERACGDEVLLHVLHLLVPTCNADLRRVTRISPGARKCAFN